MTIEKEWSENPEDDPIALQKKQLELGKKFLAKIEEQEAAAKQRESEYKVPLGGPCPVYTPPTFEEVSAVLKKAWEGVEAIMPTAGDRVKAIAFTSLMHAAAPPPKAFGGIEPA